MRFILLTFVVASVHAQVVINGGQTVLGPVDNSGATTTKPFKVGAELPGSCTQGAAFFRTNAPAGLYTCTATDTWASGSGDVAGPASAIDSEVVLFDSTTGKLIKRATGTGVAKLAAGVLSASAVSLTADVSGTLPAGSGGTGQTAATINATLVADGSAFIATTLPSCSNPTDDKLLYNSTTRAFSCGSDETGAGSGIATLNTLTGSTQTFSKTDDTNVILTLTPSGTDHNFALGWTGTLSKARSHAAAVYSDQANTFGAFLQDFASGTMRIPVAAGLAETVSGRVGYDSTANLYKVGVNGASKTLAFLDSSITGTAAALTSNGSNCGAGLLPRGVDAAGAAEGCAAVSLTTEVTGILPGANGGTNNGFLDFAGPATTLKTFTLPNASALVLTDNAAVTVAQGGTGITAGTSGGVPYYSSTSAIASSAALAINAVVLGGGAGASPASSTLTATVVKAASGVLSAASAGTDYVVPGGNVATASALAANGGNCGAGLLPRGVDASGATEGCAAASLTADVAGILPGANGGTENGFFAVAGPTASLKTFTYPDASATVLTTNAAVTVAQGGTGIASGTSGGVAYFSGSTTIASSAELTANRVVLGGGSGAAPTVLGAGTTTTVLHGNAAGAPTFGAVSLTADVSGILPGANGGTNSAFMDFTGPATSLKTFTLPNASSTILTTNAAVTVAQGGTGVASGTSGGIPYFSGSTTIASSGALTVNAVVLGGGAGASPIVSTLTATVVKAATGVLSAATAGTDYSSPSSTDSMTNKTLDAEGTGNSITLPFTAYLTAAGCNNATATAAFDLPTASAPTASCIGTTNTTGLLEYADGSTTAASSHFRLPGDWSGAVDIRLLYSGSTSSANNIRWQVSTACVADDQDLAAPSFNATSAANSAGPTTLSQRKTATFSSVAVTNCAAGETMYMKFERVGADGGDTYTGAARLLAAELMYRRAL